MPSTQVSLAAKKGLLAVRGTLLDSGGVPLCEEVDGSAYSMCPQTITSNEQTEAGQTETIRCGSGDVFATIATDDTITSLNLTLQLTAADIELAVLLTGAVPYFDPTDTDLIGLEDPGNITRPGIEFHAWRIARVGPAQAASPYGYWHYLWPKTTWRLQPIAAEEGFSTLDFTGRAEGNPSLFPGGFEDIPDEFVGNGFQAWWRADDVPDPTDPAYDNGNVDGGFIPTPLACTS